MSLGKSAKENYPKQIRIRRAPQYRHIQENGRRKSGQFLRVVYVLNNLDSSRFGISVGRKYGGAVQRNWLKRRIREAIRKKRGIVGGHWDVIFCPKITTDCPTYAELEQDVSRLLKLLTP